MSVLPQPETMVKLAELRQAEFHAEAERSRLLKLAQTNNDRRQPWFDYPAAKAIAVLLALLHATSQRG